MKPKKANIVSFYDLSEEWQKEAESNLGKYAEESFYIEPPQKYNPNLILWDLNECFPAKGNHNGFIYNAVISISNNSAMFLRIDETSETCRYIFV